MYRWTKAIALAAVVAGGMFALTSTAEASPRRGGGFRSHGGFHVRPYANYRPHFHVNPYVHRPYASGHHGGFHVRPYAPYRPHVHLNPYVHRPSYRYGW